MDFRGRRIDANVHQHDEFYLVTFSDDEVLNHFGGVVRVSSDLKTLSNHYHGEDEKKFHSAIVHELAKRLRE